MSDPVVQSNHESDGKGKESSRLHQSVWMAHWMHTTEDWESKQIGLEIPPSISKSAKRIREVPESRPVNCTNKSLKLGSEKFGCKRVESHTKLNLTHTRDTIMTPRNVTIGRGVVSGIKTSSGGDHFQNGVTGNRQQQAKSLAESLQKKSLAVSASFQRDVGLSSTIVPYRVNSRVSPFDSSSWQQEELNQPSHLVTSKEHWEKTKFLNYSTSLVHEKKYNNSVPVFVGKQREDLQNHNGNISFLKWRSPLDSTKSETVLHDFFSVPKISGSLPICTAVDSAIELSGNVPKFSQFTDHFMITKKTDINLSEGGKIFRDSTSCTDNNGKMLNKFLSLSPGFGYCVQHGVKLQPLGSSSESEGRENIGDVKTSKVCLKNESSAETHTVDAHGFQTDHFFWYINRYCGMASFATNEIQTIGQVLSTSQVVRGPSTDKTGGRLPTTALSEMNEELPAVPAVACSVDDRETSTSRTQSLGVVSFLSQAELPTNSKSIVFPGGHMGSEPSIRWVKRLKLSASGSCAHGIKSSKMEETSSHEEVNKFFSKIMRCSMTSSEPKMRKCPDNGPLAPVQTAALSRTGESSSTESGRKTQEMTPSIPWIRRWCHQIDVCPTQNQETSVVCEAERSNAASEEFRKKQFPSVGAMALMGKALNSFQPCEYRERGTYVVWSTQGI